MTVEADVAVIKEVLERFESTTNDHFEELNGTVAGLVKDSLIQKGFLYALTGLVAVASAGTAIGATIVGLARLGG